MLLALVLLLAADARAYTYESPLSEGCHEQLTARALRAVRAASAAAGAPAQTLGEDALVVRDVPFGLDDDLRDIAAVALLIGVRDNDLAGRHGLDSTHLANVHGDPDGQRAHCLRRPSHDEPDGSALALAECRAFVRERVLAARAALGPGGVPDLTRRVDVSVYLSIVGTSAVPLPAFYAELGRALHTLQDSFTHTYRSGDGLRVTTVLNWIEHAHGGLVEDRDGPAHASGLDVCSDLDGFLEARKGLALRASTELLEAAFAPDAAALDAVLDRYLTLEPGCTAHNRWCDAPERAYADSASGCASGAVTWPALFVLAVFARRRARAGRTTSARDP